VRYSPLPLDIGIGQVFHWRSLEHFYFWAWSSKSH